MQIRYVENSDKTFWFSLDKHLSENEFYEKVRTKKGYVILVDNIPIGLLRYNLFWDNTPFCTMLYINKHFQSKGFGRALMQFWESEMKGLGYNLVLTSTRIDENAQYFYRKLGYKECGSLTLDEPTELILSKIL